MKAPNFGITKNPCKVISFEVICKYSNYKNTNLILKSKSGAMGEVLESAGFKMNELLGVILENVNIPFVAANCSFNYVQEIKSGTVSTDGTWSGIYGMLQREAINFNF